MLYDKANTRKLPGPVKRGRRVAKTIPVNQKIYLIMNQFKNTTLMKNKEQFDLLVHKLNETFQATTVNRRSCAKCRNS